MGREVGWSCSKLSCTYVLLLLRSLITRQNYGSCHFIICMDMRMVYACVCVVYIATDLVYLLELRKDVWMCWSIQSSI